MGRPRVGIPPAESWKVLAYLFSVLAPGPYELLGPARTIASAVPALGPRNEEVPRWFRTKQLTYSLNSRCA